MTALLAALRTHGDRAMVLAMVLGGLRRCEVLGPRSGDIQGGLAGCGFLTAHLSSESEAAAGAIIEALARALSRVRRGLRVE